MKLQKEMQILARFRSNAREPLTKMSKKTRIPVSTIFDKLRSYENKVIRKHTSLLNFQELGYDLKAKIFFEVKKDFREAFTVFLKNNIHINSIFRVNNGFDFLVEALFRSVKEFDKFIFIAEQKGASKKLEFFVLEDVATEIFLSDEERIYQYKQAM